MSLCIHLFPKNGSFIFKQKWVPILKTLWSLYCFKTMKSYDHGKFTITDSWQELFL